MLMVIDSLLNLIALNPKISKLGSRFADFIFPDYPKIYKVFAGPGRALRLKLNARTQTSFLFGAYERANVNFLLTRIFDKAIFWDIGANIGYFSCIMARCLTKGEVVCVEPLPENIRLLREHMRINNLKNIIIIDKALSSSEKSASFLVAENLSEGKIADNKEDLPEKKIQIAVTTIDSLMKSGIPMPDIVKIDTEGEEGEILKGARAVLQNRPPSFLIEIHGPENAQICWDILSGYLYRIKFFNGVYLEEAEGPQDIADRHIWAELLK